MAFFPELADMRFGCGLSPMVAPPASPQAVIDQLAAPDGMAERYPLPRFGVLLKEMALQRDLNKRRRDQPGNKELVESLRGARADLRHKRLKWYRNMVLRWAYTDQGFRERLVFFWADHFTAIGKSSAFRNGNIAYREQAIRPYVAGRFADLLVSAVSHPLMLHYLDQQFSIGPNSRRGLKSDGARGLNENLAREVLELHTLGVDGPYSQTDVRELARLFTGMSYDLEIGRRYRPANAEPGPISVLGHDYGAGQPRFDRVRDVLEDLAVHPATARHIARKLAVHFTHDEPDPALVDHLTARYTATGGNLMQVYAALLEHPSAWDPYLRNVKPPTDYMLSACRALAPDPDQIKGLKYKAANHVLLRPSSLMGQLWAQPGGPDGWPEQDEYWVTPQAVSARLRWALSAPRRLRPDLPEPIRFAETSLGPYLNETVRFAAGAAENRADAIGLVLIAPAFQRR